MNDMTPLSPVVIQSILERSLHFYIDHPDRDKKPVYCISGPPAVGKTAVIGAAVKAVLGSDDWSHFRAIHLSQHEPVDIGGAPIPDLQAGVTRHLPFELLPSAKDIAEGKAAENGVIVFDEYLDAMPLTLAAVKQLITAGHVGGYTLPKGWQIILATNRAEDRASVTRPMASEQRSRVVQLTMAVDWRGWVKWADSANVHPLVTSFIRTNQERVYDFDPSATAYPNYRGWHDVSELEHQDMFGHLTDTMGKNEGEATFLTLVAGIVGPGAAAEYVGFRKVWRDLPNPKKVLADPEGQPVPTEPSTKHLIGACLGNIVTAETFGNFVTYLERFDQADYAVAAIQRAITRDPTLKETTAFVKLVTERHPNWID